jgi:two-component system response regulator AtoC
MATILVVEDDNDVRKALSRALSRRCNVESAVHGEDALRQLRGGMTPDFVLSDTDMPVMDGVAFAQIMKTEFPHTRLALMTGGDATAVARRSGVKCFSKPFEIDEILAEMTSAS